MSCSCLRRPSMSRYGWGQKARCVGKEMSQSCSIDRSHWTNREVVPRVEEAKSTHLHHRSLSHTRASLPSWSHSRNFERQRSKNCIKCPGEHRRQESQDLTFQILVLLVTVLPLGFKRHSFSVLRNIYSSSQGVSVLKPVLFLLLSSFTLGNTASHLVLPLPVCG